MKHCLVILSIFISVSVMADEKELKKLAHNLYVSEQYAEAAKLFHQLIQSDTANRMNHYFYGVSLLQSGGSRAEAIKFLESASAETGVPAMVHYHLAKAYQLNNRFDKAIQSFENFKRTANPVYIEELKVDEQLAMCMRAGAAIESKNEITIEHIQETTVAQFAITYNEQSPKSRLLAVPDRIRNGRAKEKFSTFLFVDETGKWMSYSGPGKNSGKEIYIASRKNSNEWNEATPVRFEKPFPYAAENPVVTNNGTQLHFACNTFNSIGGYDVFESQLNVMSGTWSYPAALPIPVNSPADEMIFIPSVKVKKAALLSNRNSAVNQSGLYYLSYPFTEENRPGSIPVPALALKQEVKNVQADLKTEIAHAGLKPVESAKVTATSNSSAGSLGFNETPVIKNEPAQERETKITLTGFYYDASRMNYDRFPELIIKTKQGIYRSSLQYPSGEFAITVPAQSHYEIALEGNIQTEPIGITLKESKDSCTIVLISRKSENGYALATIQQHEKMNDHQYAIQLGAFREKAETDILSYYHAKGVMKAEVISRQDLKLVIAGKDLSLTTALKERKAFLQNGFNDAFIVMRKGNEVIPPDWDMAMLR